jgi:hypothetical protein
MYELKITSIPGSGEIEIKFSIVPHQETSKINFEPPIGALG